MKKLFVLIFALLVLTGLSVPALADTGTVQMELQTQVTEARQGDTLELTLTVNADAPCDSYGYYLELDPAIFTVVSYELQDANTTQFSTFDNKGLVVAYGMPATPKDVQCHVTLQLKEDAPLGEVSLQGKPAARLGTESLSAAGNGTALQVLCRHSFDSWHHTDDNTHTGTCTRCGHVEVTAHTWDEGAFIQEPTCTESGTLVHVCTGCSYVGVFQAEPRHTYDHDCDADCNLCGATRTISHKYEEAWHHDAEGHYQPCTVCGAVPFKKAHTPSITEATDKEAVICTECSYIITPKVGHTHEYADTFSMDAAGHWLDCDGCMEKGSLEAHHFDSDCDTVCDKCGYERQVRHEVDSTWISDEETHYRMCTKCGEKVQVLRHAPGEKATEFTARLCLVCQRELSPALGHHMSESWYFDEEGHFHKCECGETDERKPHIWSDRGVNGIITCTVCGAETEAVPLWIWIALGAALLAAIGCIVAVIIRRKGSRPEEAFEEEDFFEEEKALDEEAETEETEETEEPV